MTVAAIDPTNMANQLTRASAFASTNTPSTGTSSTDSTTITSADFLTLLVTELKNQDPTQPTDPTAYVQQLVGVNSLQQLINIDQVLGGGTTSSSTTSSSTSGSSTSGSSTTGTTAV